MFIRHIEKFIDWPVLCQQHIDAAEKRGFEQSLVGEEQILNTRIRNNSSSTYFSETHAKMITDYLVDKCLVPELEDYTFSSAGDFFRVYRYEPGNYFKPHKDGSVEKNNEVSLITLLIYLNDADGGDTVIMPYGKLQEWAYKRFSPKCGDALMFEHNIWHSGEPVNSGFKYVLRTDLFYTCNDAVKAV